LHFFLFSGNGPNVTDQVCWIASLSRTKIYAARVSRAAASINRYLLSAPDLSSKPAAAAAVNFKDLFFDNRLNSSNAPIENVQ